MGDIKLRDENLPATIEGLAEYVLIGKEKIKLHLAKIKAIKNIGKSEEVYKIALQDGQDAGIYVIEAEKILGEELSKNKPTFSQGKDGKIKGQKILPDGINWKTSHEAQTLAKKSNITKVDKIINDMIGHDKIPTPQNVYQKIKSEENKEARKKKELEENKNYGKQIAIIKKADCLVIIDDIEPMDLLITDPPYFTDGDFTSHISKYLKKVKPTGQAYVFIGTDPDEISAYINMDKGNMILQQILVWNYNNTGQRQPNTRYTSNYQLCLYLRGVKALDLNKPADGKEQYACQTINAPDGRIGDRYHKWQKPIELIERLIKNSSKEGDYIFDPFAGSGTMILAGAKLGRIAKGCDIDEEAIKICIERGCKQK